MKASEFAKSSGRLVRVGRSAGAYMSFVPANLPPKFVLDQRLTGLLSEADRAVGRLAGIGQSMPNPHLLLGVIKRHEAVQSSRIEGTRASLSDIALLEAREIDDEHGEAGDAQEVLNYVHAMDYGLERLGSLPLSRRLLCEMHRILMTHVRGHHSAPGQVRRSQNWIGGPSSTPATAIYVPPPPHLLSECLSAFERFMNRATVHPPLVKMAMLHYQFEAIHPFLDGNGRIGRLLITLLLCRDGVLPAPLLYLSEFIEQHRQEYYRCLLDVSRRDAWREWLEYFLFGVATQGAEASQRVARLIALRGEFHRRLHDRRTPALLLRLVDELFATPAITIKRAAEVLEMTWTSAQQQVARLVAVGILREATGRRRDRVYLSEEIVKAASEPAVTP